MPALSVDRPAWVAAEPFSSVSAVRELPNGGVLVADFTDRGVFLVTSAGQGRRQVGREGAGPNEYRTPSRLIPLPGDTTLVLDRDAHRYLLIDGDGRLVETRQFPPLVDAGAEFMRGADQQGRLFFTVGFLPRSPDGPSTIEIQRWDRRLARVDTVATIMAPNPKPISRTLPGGQKVTGRRLMPYTPQDEWVVAPSGRLVLVRAAPYRVDWREADGRITKGEAVSFDPVRVTEADKRRREPDGPPFQLEYPQTKPAFWGGRVVVDDRDHVFVQRERAAAATHSTWDGFDARGKYLGSRQLPANKQIVAISARFVYVVRTDEDDLRWLEAYAR
jgi:hypothetical protein